MSDMNLSDILQIIQGARAQLELWGVTAQGLWLALGVALIFFALSLREVASWYFRVNQVRAEVRALRAEMLAMQNTLNEVRDFMKAGEEAGLQEDEPAEKSKSNPLKPETAESRRFRFDH